MLKNLFNLLSVRAFAQRTSVDDPLQKFNYRLLIPGLPSGIGFQKVSGLGEEVNVTTYAESGSDYDLKMPGRRKVSEITAERGEYADYSLRSLLKDALTSSNFRKTIIIQKLNRFGGVAKTYKLAEAWVSKWEGSDMDASSDDVSIEKVTIQFEHYID